MIFECKSCQKLYEMDYLEYSKLPYNGDFFICDNCQEFILNQGNFKSAISFINLTNSYIRENNKIDNEVENFKISIISNGIKRAYRDEYLEIRRYEISKKNLLKRMERIRELAITEFLILGLLNANINLRFTNKEIFNIFNISANRIQKFKKLKGMKGVHKFSINEVKEILGVKNETDFLSKLQNR